MIATMRLRRFDLPLETIAASRFLPWIIAALIYLAVVALAVAAVAERAYALYDMRARLVTVTLPSIDGGGDRQIEATLDILRQSPGVTSASRVPDDELARLIEPWLGTGQADRDLPLPRLIDVTLDPTAKPDLAALQDRLQEVAPGASIGIEAVTRDRSERLAAFFRAWAGGAGVLLLLGAPVLIALITRTSLNMLSETVELLRLMGAPDRYIARQFERHALLNSIIGGLIGFALAALTVVLLLYSGRQMELAGSIELGLRPLDWLLLACVPLVAVLVITAVARMTAAWRLSRMA